MCGRRYKLLLDSQQRELPLAKDEKLVSWEEIIFREETDNIACIHRVNPLLPPLLGGVKPPALEQRCSVVLPERAPSPCGTVRLLVLDLLAWVRVWGF